MMTIPPTAGTVLIMLKDPDSPLYRYTSPAERAEIEAVFIILETKDESPQARRLVRAALKTVDRIIDRLA